MCSIPQDALDIFKSWHMLFDVRAQVDISLAAFLDIFECLDVYVSMSHFCDYVMK